jgi:carbon-monoxide dehydrogenase small subunit
MKIHFTVNGKRRSYSGPGMKRLLDVLREDLSLPGTKEGCGEGECGACTVRLDGDVVVSCLVPVGQVEGRRVQTVESLGRPDRLSPLQEAFLTEGAAQCGICTPGMLMTASAYLQRGGSADDDAIRRELAGNMCRCTGYQHIVRAVQKAARRAKPTARRPAGRRRAARGAGREGPPRPPCCGRARRPGRPPLKAQGRAPDRRQT